MNPTFKVPAGRAFAGGEGVAVGPIVALAEGDGVGLGIAVDDGTTAVAVGIPVRPVVAVAEVPHAMTISKSNAGKAGIFLRLPLSNHRHIYILVNFTIPG